MWQAPTISSTMLIVSPPRLPEGWPGNLQRELTTVSLRATTTTSPTLQYQGVFYFCFTVVRLALKE